MASHSQPSPPPSSDQDGELVQVEPIDPLHDIDGAKTLKWVGVFVLIVFGGMWVLALGFGFFLDQEQHTKVWDRDTVELNALREREAQDLAKSEDLGSGKQRISIEDAMRRLAQK